MKQLIEHMHALDAIPNSSLDNERKYRRLRRDNPKVAKLRAIKAIDIATGKSAVAKQYFDGLLDRVDGGLEGLCLVVYGPTGAGKTHILKHLRKDPILQSFETEEGIQRPMLALDAPAPCTLRTLGMRMLKHLGLPFSRALREHEVWDCVVANLHAQGVGVVFIDEMHNVLSGRKDTEREKIAMTLKSLMVSETNPIQLILSGLDVLSKFIQKYEEVERRSHFLEVTPLTSRDRSKAVRFLKDLQVQLGFPGSGFDQDDMPERFMIASQGYIGRIAYFAQEAAALAVSLDGDIIAAEYLAEAYRRPFGVSPDNNPFLMANINQFRTPKRQFNYDDLTKLKGRKKLEESLDEAA
ncbi:MAG: TniB family NTP-binding protein [Pseudorhodoplanes sp.]|nr:TniB family NTP-binding protein [Pseudorhodoplanes sp.]